MKAGTTGKSGRSRTVKKTPKPHAEPSMREKVEFIRDVLKEHEDAIRFVVIGILHLLEILSSAPELSDETKTALEKMTKTTLCAIKQPAAAPEAQT